LAFFAAESYFVLCRRRRNISPPSPQTPAANDNERRRAMTYGLSTSAFIEDGPEVQAMRTRSSYSTARSWRALTAERRLALIEQALAPANDRIDAYPLAL